MSQAEKARHFADLHKKGDPVVLYNIWDAGGAKTLASAGAPAIATGSWSVAAAHGFDDGERMPLDFSLMIVERICATVDVPVTVDFEGGYAVDPSDVAENVRRVIRAGAIGINFEDRVVGGEGLHPIPAQVERIEAITAMAEEEGVPLVLNARTDLFLGTDPDSHKDFMGEAQEREAAYAEAGAGCFFVPGLTDAALISQVVETATLPVNVMMMGPLRSVAELSALGVSRLSYGPAPFRTALSDLKRRFEET
ncbi:isocitrate lyase/PEP mutase family protein [Roseobacter sinensis]|uniref:Isocitrate lyase/phosphoenolpyruvate mutase family protein n=1 Tax=Roseobacter sinensis TaxID=2931391 RepID=A0ABT3B9R0_9RHOB|nr:isocitrate lyase/phosphoenolpyruvate mutase family protein [Roseobacter sp. WL0113]MCV3270174.1 isocitrate lyase/phosphoenolpyruvate mutase family protein [Roseobacter sp. WL0113]